MAVDQDAEPDGDTAAACQESRESATAGNESHTTLATKSVYHIRRLSKAPA